MNSPKSKQISTQLHHLIPGGCHTYAKGDDQFPESAPGVIARGQGCHVWDADENEFIEYGMGLRSVSLGHAFPPIVSAVREALLAGTNFTRPSIFEAQCAETLLGSLVYGEMVKFAKDGSTVTTAAFKLSRALTGRSKIAICADHPFFAIHDWFIGTTEINGGTLREIADLTVKFRYNDPESLAHLFRTYPNQIACVMLEPAKNDEPEDNFLHKVRELAHANGALFVLDEMITGFRWHNAGAQALYGVEPDLACFGKAMANGFSVSALVGKREYMEVGGLYHDRERVFLLSTTHGAETHALAAAMATIDFYRHEPVIETLNAQGTKLANGIRRVIARHQLEPYVSVVGRPCNLVFTTKDPAGQLSQEFRTLLMQELVARGILAPSLVVSYSHGDEDLNQTIRAFDGALAVYRDAIQHGLSGRLRGRPTQVVYRKYNAPPYRSAKQRATDDGIAVDEPSFSQQN